jgi:hypothetical protein
MWAAVTEILAVASPGSRCSVRPGCRESSPLANLEADVFMVLLLDAQNRLIEAQEHFRGTVSQTVVYPREVVKAALVANASSVIFAHNHPSGQPEPSRAGRTLTGTLKKALATVDIAVLECDRCRIVHNELCRTRLGLSRRLARGLRTVAVPHSETLDSPGEF